MSTSVTGLTTNFFPSAQNGFTTTTSGSVSSGATTVGLNSVAGYVNGQVAVFVIDPTDATKKQTFTGVIDTAGVQVTDVVWTAGTNQAHALGATVVDYETATHWSMMTKGILTHADQDGTLKAGAVDVAAVIADGIITKAKLATAEKAVFDSGWSTKYGDTTVPAPDTVTCNGNRSYDLVFNSVDLTGYFSPGMRQKYTRTVTASTQCADLESGSSQYFSKTSPAAMTFTDDFVVSAWIKLESYVASTIISRFNGTSGFIFSAAADGTLLCRGYNAASANYSGVASYQSIPLNKWVHVAVQLDMSAFTATSTTSYLMIDGVDVPAYVARSGTNPTALVQAGDFQIGAYNGATNPFDGKIAQVAIYNAKVTQANIRATISQGLTGSETSLISAYSFNNSINDLSANGNDLTANGGALATATDSPFSIQADGTTAGTTDYAIITKAAFSTNTTLTVQVPEGNTIPTTGGVSAVAYSTQKAPYGMPIQKDRWTLESRIRAQNSAAGVSTGNLTYNATQGQLEVPVGSWKLSSGIILTILSSGTAGNSAFTSVSSSSSTVAIGSEEDKDMGGRLQTQVINVGTTLASYRQKNISLSTATTYYNLIGRESGNVTTITLDADNGPFFISAECAYL